MVGASRRKVALDRQKRVVAVGANEDMENGVDPLQSFTAALQRRDGVVEVRGSEDAAMAAISPS